MKKMISIDTTTKIVLTGMFVLTLWSCTSRPRPAVDIEADDFLSETRYISTRQERKEFKKLPPSERAAFIESFWRIRDPDPDTEINEFREEYYLRIEKANQLFREGSKGWLSDRGRIFILIGEPDRRDVYPTGYTFYDPPVEIWWYGFFTIAFVDYDREGVYRLSTESAQKLNTINIAQMRFKHDGLTQDKQDFQFNLMYRETDAGPALMVTVPYSLIAVNEPKDGTAYTTRLSYALTVYDDSGKKVKEQNGHFDLSIAPMEFIKEKGAYSVQMPLDLSSGRFRAVLNIQNETDQKRKGQSIVFRIR